MEELSLEDIKQHIGIVDYDGDDDYLLSLIDASKNVVEGMLGYSFKTYYNSYGEVLPIFIHSQRMIIAGMYRDREPSSSLNLKENPFGLNAYLSPYSNLFF